jgi:hypothetical protein
MSWSADSVREAIEPLRPHYIEQLSQGQPEGWIPDRRTLDLWCIGQWMMMQLKELPQDERIRRLWYFNRKCRAEHDLFAVAARAMNGENDP